MSDIRISEIGIKMRHKKKVPNQHSADNPQTLTLTKNEQRMALLLYERDLKIAALKADLLAQEQRMQKVRRMVLDLGVVSEDTWNNWLRPTKEKVSK